jgi:LPXTG-motif cell wall-anchored protein
MKKMNISKVCSILLALLITITSLAVFAPATLAADTTLTVGTDSNNTIRNTLIGSASGDNIILSGRGSVTLNAGDVIRGTVYIQPDASQTISITHGQFSMLTLQGASLNEEIDLNSVSASMVIQSNGTAQFKHSVISNSSSTPYSLNGGALKLLDVSSITGTAGIALQINNSAEEIYVSDGCSITGGTNAISTDGSPVNAGTVGTINIYGTVKGKSPSAIYIRPNMTLDTLRVWAGGTILNDDTVGAGIVNCGNIRNLLVDAGGSIKGVTEGILNEHLLTYVGQIGSLSNAGDIQGNNSILNSPNNDPSHANIGSTAFDINNGFLWGKTYMGYVGTLTACTEQTPILSVDADVSTSTWKWTATVKRENATTPIQGLKTCVYNTTDSAVVVSGTTDATGKAALSFNPVQGKSYEVRSYAFWDTVGKFIYSSSEFAPQLNIMPTVTGLAADTKSFSSGGGTVTFTVTGNNLQFASNLSVRSDIGSLTGQISPITGSSSDTATVTLPANTTSSNIIYTFKPWINGTEQNFPAQVTVLAQPPAPVPAVTGIAADTKNFSSSGGTVTFTVTGSNLQSASNLSVRSDIGNLTGQINPISGNTSDTATITLPANATGNNVTYTFKPWLNGTEQNFPVQVVVSATAASNASLPSVETETPSGITVSGVTLSGKIISEGSSTVSERGFIYGKVSNLVIGGSGVIKVPSSNGTSSFTSTLSSLDAGTAYYVRTYAISNAGTSYGTVKSFSTTAASAGDLPNTGDAGNNYAVALGLSGVTLCGSLLLLHCKRKKNSKNSFKQL